MNGNFLNIWLWCSVISLIYPCCMFLVGHDRMKVARAHFILTLTALSIFCAVGLTTTHGMYLLHYIHDGTMPPKDNNGSYGEFTDHDPDL